jgi:hypothetical protein
LFPFEFELTGKQTKVLSACYLPPAPLIYSIPLLARGCCCLSFLLHPRRNDCNPCHLGQM